MGRIVLALLAFTACGKPKPPADWSKTPFKTIEASAGGIAYSIEMPETWESRKPKDEGWAPNTGDPLQRPSVMVANVSQDLATSLESAIATAGMKPEQVVRKETKPDGYHLTETHDQTLIHVAVFQRVGGSYLWCTAQQASDAGIPRFDETKQALVKICESIVVK